MNLLARFTKIDDTRGISGGTVTHVPGLFYRFVSRDGEHGHIRLFKKPTGGVLLHHWSRAAPGWAQTRTWNVFGLATIIHIERGDELKRCNREGWHFRFASIFFERCYGGFMVGVRRADRGYSA